MKINQTSADVKRWSFILPLATPSGNETLRQHHWARAEHKTGLGWLLASALNLQPKIPDATGKRRLTIIRHGKRALDQDNLAAGCKSLIDCLKERRLILDDCPVCCELVFEQVPCGKLTAFTVLILEDVAS
jgi:hypothetical protein